MPCTEMCEVLVVQGDIVLRLKPEKMKHRIVNGLHIIEYNGHIHVYTEREYAHIGWWQLVLIKYNLNTL